jgi:hypothetical protein
MVLVLVVSGASSAFAQHNHSATSAQTSAPESQGDPMQECQKHHAEGAAALGQAATDLARAKQLTDADQMRAAIALAEKQIAQAKHHLSMCPMIQGGSTDLSAVDHSQHQQHKMKCMPKDSQPE